MNTLLQNAITNNDIMYYDVIMMHLGVSTSCSNGCIGIFETDRNISTHKDNAHP